MWIFGSKGPSGFSARSTAEEVTHGIDASGLTAIVTGASSGIGAETARVLALRGVHVIMAVRNVESGRKVEELILKEVPHVKLDIMELDVSSMASVRKFASTYVSSGLPLNILINNAGIFGCPFMLSQDGIELQFATNHLGHFLLTSLLLETMKKTWRESNREGRIVILSSMGHHSRLLPTSPADFTSINNELKYHAANAYMLSKLANILHANELARRLKAEGIQITANSVHPGVIATNIGRHSGILNAVLSILKYVFKSIPQGAATTCYVALHPNVKGVSGEYFADCNIAKTSGDYAHDVDLAKKLWDLSIQWTQLDRT